MQVSRLKQSVIGCNELEKLVKELSPVRIIDTRDRDSYHEGHIPGAISMVWSDWSAPPPDHVDKKFSQPGWWGELSSELDFATRLSKLGLSSNERIIVYGDGPGTRGRDGRVAWMLLRSGAQDVSLLSGGWSDWVAGGRTVFSNTPSLKKGDFDFFNDKIRSISIDGLRGLS